MNDAQAIVDKYQSDPEKLMEQLWSYYVDDEPRDPAKLKEIIEVTLFHGTRRKESLEDIKKNGICTLTGSQVNHFIDEAISKCKVGMKAGPRVCKWIDEKGESLKRYYSGRIQEFGEKGTPTIWAGVFKKACCSWAYRNPEIVWDSFYWNTPETVIDEVLTELFGTPKCIQLKLKVPVEKMVGSPQNLNTERRCFSPEEIADVKECTREDVIKAYGGKMPLKTGPLVTKKPKPKSQEVT